MHNLAPNFCLERNQDKLFVVCVYNPMRVLYNGDLQIGNFKNAPVLRSYFLLQNNPLFIYTDTAKARKVLIVKKTLTSLLQHKVHWSVVNWIFTNDMVSSLHGAYCNFDII